MTDSPLPFPETALLDFVQKALQDIKSGKNTKNNQFNVVDDAIPASAPVSDRHPTAASTSTPAIAPPLTNKSNGAQPPPLRLTRHHSIEGDDHMIFSIDRHPEYILRVTKPRANRGCTGLEMQMRENAVLNFFRSQYLRRGLEAGTSSILPECVASCPDLMMLGCEAVVAGEPRLDGEKEEECPGTYAAEICTRLYGKTLDEVEPMERTLDDLATLMGIMKSVDDLDGFEKKLGVKLPRIEFPSLIELRREAMDAWTKIISNGDFDVDKTLLDTVSSSSSRTAGSRCDAAGVFVRKTAFINDMETHLLEDGWSTDLSKMVFVHNDIKGEHILVDERTGSITGILDWADAGFGHPAIDIYGLVLTVGRNAAERISREVGYDEETILQGVLLALCSCVLNLDGRLRGVAFLEAPVDLLKQQLRTSLRDSEDYIG